MMFSNVFARNAVAFGKSSAWASTDRHQLHLDQFPYLPRVAASRFARLAIRSNGT